MCVSYYQNYYYLRFRIKKKMYFVIVLKGPTFYAAKVTALKKHCFVGNPIHDISTPITSNKCITLCKF